MRTKCKLTPCVIDGEMVFKVVSPVSPLIIDDISDQSLKDLNIQRFKIRNSQRVTGQEVRELERKHRRWAKV